MNEFNLKQEAKLSLGWPTVLHTSQHLVISDCC